jgi:hypothetical protein
LCRLRKIYARHTLNHRSNIEILLGEMRVR